MATAAAQQESQPAAARERLAQANAAHSALTQQLADAQTRLATRQHLDRLVDQRPSEEQPDADHYARRLLERANQLRQEVDARTRNRVVATAVVNAYVRLNRSARSSRQRAHDGYALQQYRPTSFDHQSPRHRSSAWPKVKPRHSFPVSPASSKITYSRPVSFLRTPPGNHIRSDQEIADLLKRKDDLSFQLLSVRKDLRAMTLERTRLRRRLHGKREPSRRCFLLQGGSGEFCFSLGGD
jgi:hypothetical protein